MDRNLDGQLDRSKQEALRPLTGAIVLGASIILMAGAALVGELAAAPESGGLPFVWITLLLIHTGVAVTGLWFRGQNGGLVVFFSSQLSTIAALLLIGETTTPADLTYPLLAQAVFVSTSLRGFAAVVIGVVAVATLAVVRHEVPVNVTTNFAVGAAFVTLMAHLMVRHARERARAERLARDLSEANATLAELLGQAEEAAATRERTRIAREIHDSIGHCLTSALIHMQVAGRTTEASEVSAALVRARELAREGLAELRRAVEALRAPEIPVRPLPEAIRTLVCASPLEVDFDIDGDPRAVPPASRYVLFRAAQEALTNILRHAQADRVSIRLRYDQARVVLDVRDYGVGAEATGQRRGHGLLGIQERLQEVGGQLTIATAPDEGFAVTAEVPA